METFLLQSYLPVDTSLIFILLYIIYVWYHNMYTLIGTEQIEYTSSYMVHKIDIFIWKHIVIDMHLYKQIL